MTPSLDFFGEGATEEKILAKLGLPTLPKKESIAGGKAEINKRMADVLGPDLGRRPIRCLVMRDVDSHVGEAVALVKQSVEEALRRLFRERGFDSASLSLQPLQKHANVYTYQSDDPDIQIALHIADYRYLDQFIKSTVDDYVLKLAMRPATAKALLQEKRKNGWKITASQLISKIGQEIPALLLSNRIPQLVEAKDYVRFYAAVLQMHTSPQVFAGKAIAYAKEKDIREVFAPLIAAAQFLGFSPTFA